MKYPSLLLVIASLAAWPAAAQDKKAQCASLAGWLTRYDFDKGSQHVSGRKMRADVASSLCSQGRYDEGLAMLEQVTREAGYPGK